MRNGRWGSGGVTDKRASECYTFRRAHFLVSDSLFHHIPAALVLRWATIANVSFQLFILNCDRRSRTYIEVHMSDLLLEAEPAVHEVGNVGMNHVDVVSVRLV